MDYQTVVTNEFIPRCTAALNTIASALVLAGLSATSVSVTTADSTDLRFEIDAHRGSKTVLGYIELSDAAHIGGEPGSAVFTFYFDGNGSEITTDYVAGAANTYLTDDGLNALLAKLTE